MAARDNTVAGLEVKIDGLEALVAVLREDISDIIKENADLQNSLTQCRTAKAKCEDDLSTTTAWLADCTLGLS